MDVAIIANFAHKKNLLSTGFAHRKLVLWKSCGFDFYCQIMNIMSTTVVFFRKRI